MYVDSSTTARNGKYYTRYLLRTSFRENGKVKHRTIANLSDCTEAEIAAIRLALRHKDNLSILGSIKDVEAVQGKRIGAVWLLKVLAERLGIADVLGRDSQGKLALWQVMARLIGQGSRLKAVRLACSHAGCEIIGLKSLNEDDLYENLAWLAGHQEKMEKKLFYRRYPERLPVLFLYDVTSSYLEGVCNDLAAYGYNRDKKKGKMQIVVGLLTGPMGDPVAVRVFQGNTADTSTVSEQIRILAEQFGVKEVTLVGDRGMLKGPQIDELPDSFRYLTAITKPEIRRLLTEGLLQYELFSERVCEVESEGVRYILRRNPQRAEEIRLNREGKLVALRDLTVKQTKYLAEHSRATVAAAERKVRDKAKLLKIEKWVRVVVDQRVIRAEPDEAVLAKVSLLDGCYVIKTDVSRDIANTQTIHDRYKDLAQVERAFRTIKTAHLEIRPVHVRKEASTRGHVFVVMLALLLQRELERCWLGLDITVEEGIDELSAICMQEICVGDAVCQNIPYPNERSSVLLKAADIQLPATLPSRKVHVATKKKLPRKRKQLK
ncbi:MAG: IS1634 family transposase [Chloroflexota bacterium]|nr:IS1634 family transposase [Chloroflexota bacterium]